MPKLYYKNRAEAGRELAEQMAQFAKSNSTVIALNEGGVLVAAQIALKIHASLGLLLTQRINLPGEPDAISAISSSGTYTYNNMFSAGQLEDFNNEYHGYIDQQRMEKFHELNRLMGKDGEISRDSLTRHVVILVTDGLNSGFSLDIAADFLKPIVIKRLVIAVPFASVAAIDCMHLIGDEIFCLNTVENYISTDHYYEENNIPSQEDIMKIIRNNNLNWNRDETLSPN